MKVLEPGHLYELESMEGTNPQKIQFIKKEKLISDDPETNGKFATITDGTTNEEVLEVLIDRTKTLGEKLPSRENSLALTKLEEALLWFNRRTQNRLKQGVENTPLPHQS